MSFLHESLIYVNLYDLLQQSDYPSVWDIHIKTPVLESLFNKVAGLTLLKRDSNTGIFL